MVEDAGVDILKATGAEHLEGTITRTGDLQTRVKEITCGQQYVTMLKLVSQMS